MEDKSSKARLSSQAIATQNGILDAARACFAERGLAATTTREIAQKAGITQPLVHHYFGSKDALFDKVLEAVVADYVEAQSDQWKRPMDDLGFWTVGLTVLFRWLGEHPDITRLMMWARLEGRDTANKGMRAVFDWVRQRFEHARRAGVLRDDVDVNMALIMIDALFKGFWDRHSGYNSYPAAEQELSERFLSQSLRILLVGLLTPKAANKAMALLER